MKEKLIYYSRWFAIIPIAIVCYYLSYVAMKLITSIQKFFYNDDVGNSWILKYTAPIFTSGIAGYAFVSIGKKVAPKHKETVGLVLLIITCIVSGIGLFAAILLHHYMSILEIVGQTIGAIIGYKEEVNNK